MNYLFYKNRSLFLFIFIFLSINIFGQNKKDSLVIALKYMKEDSNKVKLLNELCQEYSNYNLDSADIIGKEALGISLKIGYTLGTADSYKNLGYTNGRKGDFNKALEYYSKAGEKYKFCKNSEGYAECLDGTGGIYMYMNKLGEAIDSHYKAYNIFMENGNIKKMVSCLNHIGVVYMKQGETIKAERLFQITLELSISILDKRGIMTYYQNTGLLSAHIGQYEKAIENLILAIGIAEGLKDSCFLATCYLNIGQIFIGRKMLDKSEEYVKKSIIISEKIGLKLVTPIAYLNLGTIYGMKENQKMSLKYFLKSLELASEINDENTMASVLGNIGNLYSEQGQYEKALEYYYKAGDIFIKENDKQKIPNIFLNIARSKRYLKKYNESIEFSMRGLKISEETGSVFYQTIAYENLAAAFDSTGNYYSAYKNYIKFKYYSDSLLNIEKFKQLTDIEGKYKNEKMKLEVSAKNNELQVKMITINNKNRTIYFILIVLSLTIIMLFAISVLFRKNFNAYKALVRRNLEIINQEKEIEELRKGNEGRILYNNLDIKKYSGSLLTAESMTAIIEQMELIFKVEKLYLDAGLTVEQLAKKINTHKKYVSQVINEKYQMNFNNFINKLRIDEARRILADVNNNIPIKKLCPELGFKSYASFYQAFEKFTGLTPSKFRNSIIKDSIRKTNFPILNEN